MRLYDMEKDEWRETDFKRGDKWRSRQVYKCRICGAQSNEFYMGGWPGMGPRLSCPGCTAKYNQHNLLQKKVVNSGQKKHPHVPPNVEGIEGEWEAIDGRF
jgi:hypothetical protein